MVKTRQACVRSESEEAKLDLYPNRRSNSKATNTRASPAPPSNTVNAAPEASPPPRGTARRNVNPRPIPVVTRSASRAAAVGKGPVDTANATQASQDTDPKRIRAARRSRQKAHLNARPHETVPAFVGANRQTPSRQPEVRANMDDPRVAPPFAPNALPLKKELEADQNAWVKFAIEMQAFGKDMKRLAAANTLRKTGPTDSRFTFDPPRGN